MPKPFGRHPFIEALKRIPKSKLVALMRAMVKRAVKWHKARREKREISKLCARLQLPPEKLPQLFEGKRYAEEVIQELREMVTMAEKAGLKPQQIREIFKKTRNVEQAKAIIAQIAQQQAMAA